MSYLFLRIVDTIEDSNWQDIQKQRASFAVFKSFLIQRPSHESFIGWLSDFPLDLPLEESLLLKDIPLLLEDKNTVPEGINQVMTQTMMQMIEGMQYFLDHYKMKEKMVFPSLVITNQYCFFVAGIVGKLLSHIFTSVIPDFNWSSALLNQSFHFGLFLQKINLLKDKMEDEASGRYFVSSIREVRESLVLNACHSLSYIKSIPVLEGRPYRLFCSWSLFLGLATLKGLDKNIQANKIKPRETYYLMNQVSLLIDDNRALDKLFKSYLPEGSLGKLNDYSAESREIPSWFTAIYDGGLEALSGLRL